MQKQQRNNCVAIEGLSIYDEKFKKAVKPCLIKNTENHCSYCDSHHFDNGNLHIEHYIYRKERPDLSADYSNLYISCPACNSRKRDTLYPENEPFPIRPDAQEYEFEHYFFYEHDTGKLVETGDFCQVSKITIEFLNLNHQDMCNARKKYIAHYKKHRKEQLLSYRFLNSLL